MSVADGDELVVIDGTGTTASELSIDLTDLFSATIIATAHF